MIFFESIIEILYLYKTSWLYSLHLILILLFSIMLIYAIYKEQVIMQQEDKASNKICHTTVEYADYIKIINKNTQEELIKLQQTNEYHRYMKNRLKPQSEYFFENKNYDDIQEIVFSDEQEQKKK